MSEERPTQPADVQRLTRDWIAYTLALIAILLAIYFYLAPRETRPIVSFLVDPVRATILKATSEMTDLSVTYKGQPIKGGDLIALRLYIWNDGRKTVRHEDIFDPYRCTLNGSARILESRLLRRTRDLTELSASQLSTNSVGFDFRVLEHGDGGTVQLLYVGNHDTHLQCSGAADGDPAARMLIARNDEASQSQPWWVTLIRPVSMTVACWLLILGWISLDRRLRKYSVWRAIPRGFIPGAAIMILFLGTYLIFDRDQKSSVPPQLISGN
jgi:hypothetical protein